MQTLAKTRFINKNAQRARTKDAAEPDYQKLNGSKTKQDYATRIIKTENVTHRFNTSG